VTRDEAYLQAFGRFKAKNDISKLRGQVFFDEHGRLLDSYAAGAFSTVFDQTPIPESPLPVRDDDFDEIREYSSSFVKASFHSSLSTPMDVMPAVDNVFYRFAVLKNPERMFFNRNCLLVIFMSLIPAKYSPKVVRPSSEPSPKGDNVYQPWRPDDPFVEITYLSGGTHRKCVVACAHFHSPYVADRKVPQSELEGKYSHLAGLGERQGGAWLTVTGGNLSELIVKHHRNSIAKQTAQEILVVIGFGTRLVWFSEQL